MHNDNAVAKSCQYRLTLRILSAVSLLAMMPGVAHAADTASDNASSAGLEVITVTATKRGAEQLFKTPITVQAISGNTLRAMGAKSFIDFAATVPGLQFQDLGPGDKKYVIRGVNSTGAATVGVYYDEAVITANNKWDGGGREADIRLYDINRIEVLKGPQGTLYGASSMTGTIRFIPNKPDLSDVEGYVAGEVSTTHKGGTNYHVNGMVNLPVIKDKLGVRAVGWIDLDSGYIDAIRIPSGPVNNINDDHTGGGRLQLRLKASENLTITAAATYQKTNSNGSSRYTPPGVSSYSSTTGTNFSGGTGFPAVQGGDLVNTDLTQSPWNENLRILSLTGEYVGDIGSITATTNYYKRNIDFNFDSTPILFFNGVMIPGITQQPQSQMVWSNELRYASHFSGPVNIVVGGAYQKETDDLTVNVVKSNALGQPNGLFNPSNDQDALINANGNTFFGRFNDETLNQHAIFGELTFKATDKLQAVIGARYFHSKQHSVQATTHPFGGFTSSPVGDQTNDTKGSKVTYKFNLSYQFTPEFMLYATAASGFRVGGLNSADLPFASNIPHGYGPDTLWSYEVGAKGDFLDNRLQITAAGYHINWKNIQVSAVDSTGSFAFVTNAGAAKVDGIELEMNALLTQGLTFTLGGAYQNARLTEDQPPIPNNPNLGVAGDQLPSSAHWQGNAALSYTVPLANDFSGTLRADVSYRSSTNTQFNKQSPFNVGLASYELVNLKASVANNDWTVDIFARNVFDKRAQIDAISSSQDPLAQITVRPRTLGVGVLRHF